MPARKILPLVSSAIELTKLLEPLPKLIRTRPSGPNCASHEPSPFRRPTKKSWSLVEQQEPSSLSWLLEPATSSLPSGWIASALISSLYPVSVNCSFPPSANDGSSIPSVL